MKVRILTDAGVNIGFGHLTRCIALYHAFKHLKKNNMDVKFIVDADKKSLNLIDTDNSNIVFAWKKNQKRLDVILKDANLIIVDSYRASISFFNHLKSCFLKSHIVALDDYNRLNYPVHTVINSAPFAKGIRYKQDNIKKYLLGEQFAILRKDFWNPPVKKISKNIKDILITFGGMNHSGLIKQIFIAITNLMKDVNFHYINAKVLHVKEQKNFFHYHNLSAQKMKNLMLKCDICISGGGQTLFELARIGIPTLAIGVADNQINNLKGLHKKKCIKYVGDKNDTNIIKKASKVFTKMISAEERNEISLHASTIIDGKGVLKIVESLISETHEKKRVVIATIKAWNIANAQFFSNRNPDLDVTIIKNKKEFTFTRIKKMNPDCIFFPHWSWIIPKEIYENFKCVVFHMTDLPFGRGGSPLQNLISRGIYETKISAIKVMEKIDAGPIYLKRKVNLKGSATQILKNISKKIIFNMIPYIIKKDPVPLPQKGKIVTFKRRKPFESDISKLHDIQKIYDYIRMLDAEGYPRAFFKTNKLKIEFFNASFDGKNLLADVKIRENDET